MHTRLKEGGVDLACTVVLEKMLVADQILAQQQVQHDHLLSMKCRALFMSTRNGKDAAFRKSMILLRSGSRGCTCQPGTDRDTSHYRSECNSVARKVCLVQMETTTLSVDREVV